LVNVVRTNDPADSYHSQWIRSLLRIWTANGRQSVWAALRPGALAVTAVSFTIGPVIAIWGFVPGVHDPEQVLAICWALVFGGGLGGLLVSLAAGFARDVGNNSV
jgi:hypothetical protein